MSTLEERVQEQPKSRFSRILSKLVPVSAGIAGGYAALGMTDISRFNFDNFMYEFHHYKTAAVAVAPFAAAYGASRAMKYIAPSAWRFVKRAWNVSGDKLAKLGVAMILAGTIASGWVTHKLQSPYRPIIDPIPYLKDAYDWCSRENWIRSRNIHFLSNYAFSENPVGTDCTKKAHGLCDVREASTGTFIHHWLSGPGFTSRIIVEKDNAFFVEHDGVMTGHYFSELPHPDLRGAHTKVFIFNNELFKYIAKEVEPETRSAKEGILCDIAISKLGDKQPCFGTPLQSFHDDYSMHSIKLHILNQDAKSIWFSRPCGGELHYFSKTVDGKEKRFKCDNKICPDE